MRRTFTVALTRENVSHVFVTCCFERMLFFVHCTFLSNFMEQKYDYTKFYHSGSGLTNFLTEVFSKRLNCFKIQVHVQCFFIFVSITFTKSKDFSSSVSRHFAATNMNERSSRSHTIFRLVSQSDLFICIIHPVVFYSFY